MESQDTVSEGEFKEDTRKRFMQFKVKKIKIVEAKKFSNLESISEGLGNGYNLLFTNKWNNKISATLDGKNIENFISKKDCHTLFFDAQTNELYYTKKDSLYKWPHMFVGYFDTQVWGVGKYNDEVLATLYDEGKIVNLKGKVKYGGLNEPSNIIIFQNELYHTGRQGLIKTPDKIIKQTGGWADGLCCLEDKLYFGGKNKIIYSYDGKNVEEICNVGFPIWCIHGVKEQGGNILYSGGYQKKGIEVINLSNSKERKTILEDKVNHVLSIVSVPIKFCEGLLAK